MRMARRYCGPPASANGGYTCGLLASLVAGDAEVTLRAPPPLERELVAETTPTGALLRDGDAVIASAAATTLTVESPAPVGFDDAVLAARAFPWDASVHPFPGCFVCGPSRVPGDGLCIYPGAVAERQVAAAPWVPDASVADADGLVRPEILWAALDCPSWFGMVCFHEWQGVALLGRLAARIHRRPRVDQRCVAMGWLVRRDGRKIHTASALHDTWGALLALGQATWIALK